MFAVYIYDASRYIDPMYIKSIQGLKGEFPKINLVDGFGNDDTTMVSPDPYTKFTFSSPEVKDPSKTQLPTIVTGAEYLISIAAFRGHILAGFTATGKNWFGSIYRDILFNGCGEFGYWCPRTLHDFVDVRNRGMGTYNPLVDLLGHGELGGKCILYIVDGLYGGLKQDPDDLPLKFEMTPFNGFWTNSIFISQDPVALDSVIFDFLRNEPTVSTMIYDSEGDIYCVDNYLHEAALANDPPSQTIYKPNGVDQLHSLGVHEHWNNKIDKEYTRNLGTGEGIELLMVSAPGAHCDPVPGTPVNAPMGVARGTNPGRVVWKFDPSATTWDGNMNSWWWDQKNLHQGKVSNMLGESLVKLIEGGSMNSTNTISSTSTNTSSAWDEVFRSFNQRQGNTGGYMKGEKIGIKINLNGNRQNEDNNGNGISPQLVKSIIGELVNTVGAAEEDISVYDASRYINKNMIVPPQGVNEQFPGVHLIDRFGGEITEAVTVDNNSYLKFSSQDVLMQNSTKLPVVATGARYLISIAPFRGHPLAGFTATGKNWFGSIYRVVPNHVDGKYSCGIFGAWCPWTLHDYIVVRDNEMGTYNSLVDLLGHKDLGEKCIVYIIDGLYGGEMPAGDSPPIRWKSHPFDNHWSSSIFLSQDPVALDSVVFDFIRNEPNIKSMIYNEQGNIYCVDNYLHEAAMANDPPSKTIYSPDDRGVLGSLGTHEHWNNPKDKHYSRNIDSQKGKGIQLIQLLPERDSSLKGLSPGDICAIKAETEGGDWGADRYVWAFAGK